MKQTSRQSRISPTILATLVVPSVTAIFYTLAYMWNTQYLVGAGLSFDLAQQYVDVTLPDILRFATPIMLGSVFALVVSLDNRKNRSYLTRLVERRDKLTLSIFSGMILLPLFINELLGDRSPLRSIGYASVFFGVSFLVAVAVRSEITDHLITRGPVGTKLSLLSTLLMVSMVAIFFIMSSARANGANTKSFGPEFTFKDQKYRLIKTRGNHVIASSVTDNHITIMSTDSATLRFE